MRIFTPAWGPKHLNLLNKALGQCFLWPENHEVVKDAVWSILTHDSNRIDVFEAAARIVPEKNIDLMIYNGPIQQLTQAREFVMLDCLYKMMEKCINEKVPMLIATPDFIFGDGTLSAMAAIGSQDNVCVSIPHPRVLPCVIDHIGERPMSNPELISLAFKHPHKAWTSCEVGKDPSGSYIGGISWRWVGCGVAAVQHRMPSPYWVNFTPDDIHFFKNPTGRRMSAFGAWDHDWPELLIEQGRQRLIGSSDIATLIEVTDPDMNVPPLTKANLLEPDSFQHSENHFKINRQFISSFRGS